ncbi:hypothetical protein FRC00_007292 [Tulasnella sp. 408]|nr:hypothetical protein FRC00_007292 [Tulasnella sp. 408]
MLKRTTGLLSGLFKGHKQRHSERRRPEEERLDDPGHPTDPYPDVTLVLGFGTSTTKLAVDHHASANDLKPLPDVPPRPQDPLPDIPPRGMPAEPGPIPSRDVGPLGLGSPPRYLAAPKPTLNTPLANDSTSLALSSDTHSGSQKDPARVRPQSEDQKNIKHPVLPPDFVERAGPLPAFPPTPTRDASIGTLGIDEFGERHPSISHGDTVSRTSQVRLTLSINMLRAEVAFKTSLLNPKRRATPESTASRISSNLVRPPPSPSAGEFSDVHSIQAGWLSYSEGVPPASDDEVGDTRWVKFITLVDGQHGYYRSRRATAIACGGFSDVWKCDARFSDGSHVVVAVKKLRAVNMPDDLGALEIAERLLKDNVLIDRDGNPRIIDFGLSKAVEEEPGLAALSSTSLREAGRARWMAPELLMEEGVSRSCSTDVFSFACVAFFILTGNIPFKGMSDVQVYFAWFKGSHPIRRHAAYPELEAQPDLKNVLFSCWEMDPKARPGMAAVVHALQTAGHSSESSSLPSL